MSKFFDIIQSINIDINGFVIKDAAEKIGSLLFGEEGRKIGQAIDDKTKDVTIKIFGDKKSE